MFICSPFLFVIFCFGVCTSSSASSTNICHLPKKSLLCLQNIYDRDDLETCNQSSPKLSKLHKSIMEPARCWICKQGTRDSSKSWHLRTKQKRVQKQTMESSKNCIWSRLVISCLTSVQNGLLKRCLVIFFSHRGGEMIFSEINEETT